MIPTKLTPYAVSALMVLAASAVSVLACPPGIDVHLLEPRGTPYRQSVSGPSWRDSSAIATLSNFNIRGSLDRQVVRRHVKYAEANLARCHRSFQTRRDRPPAPAPAIATFRIAASGATTNVVVSNSDVATCLRDVIDALTFPGSDGDTIVTVTIRLRGP